MLLHVFALVLYSNCYLAIRLYGRKCGLNSVSVSLSMPLSDPDLKHRAGLSAIAGLSCYFELTLYNITTLMRLFTVLLCQKEFL